MFDLIVEEVAKEAGITKSMTKRVLLAFIKVLPTLVEKYDRVGVPRLGIFYKRTLPTRWSQNPYKLTAMMAGPKTVMRFKASRNVRDEAIKWNPEEGFVDRTPPAQPKSKRAASAETK